MHLPPLDVAVYPVVTMSHGRHGGRSTRASSTISSSSSSSAASAGSCATPDFSSIQKVIRSVFRSPRITVQQVERLQGRLHQVYLVRLADGSSLVLKSPAPYNTRLLRHEKHGLETEKKTLEFLHEYTSLPVPQLIKYDSNGGSFGSPYLLMTPVTGRRLSQMRPFLSTNERNTIDHKLGVYVRSLTDLRATQFGPTHRVFAKKGNDSWRDAFLALLEAALRDAEDMLVTVPYESIRYWVGRHSHYLDEIIEPRLVAIDVCDADNVMINEQTKQVTGLVGFSNVIWGDPLMVSKLVDGNEAFFGGYGPCPAQTGGVKARLLMYATYKAVVRVITSLYRPHLDMDELEARQSLASSLHELAKM